MTEDRALPDKLETLDSLDVAVLTDDVSDNYVSKPPFAVSEFTNVIRPAPASGPARRCCAPTLGSG